MGSEKSRIILSSFFHINYFSDRVGEGRGALPYPIQHSPTTPTHTHTHQHHSPYPEHTTHIFNLILDFIYVIKLYYI